MPSSSTYNAYNFASVLKTYEEAIHDLETCVAYYRDLHISVNNQLKESREDLFEQQVVASEAISSGPQRLPDDQGDLDLAHSYIKELELENKNLATRYDALQNKIEQMGLDPHSKGLQKLTPVGKLLAEMTQLQEAGKTGTRQYKMKEKALQLALEEEKPSQP